MIPAGLMARTATERFRTEKSHSGDFAKPWRGTATAKNGKIKEKTGFSRKQKLINLNT